MTKHSSEIGYRDLAEAVLAAHVDGSKLLCAGIEDRDRLIRAVCALICAKTIGTLMDALAKGREKGMPLIMANQEVARELEALLQREYGITPAVDLSGKKYL